MVPAGKPDAAPAKADRYLSEVAEDEASGQIADLYEDIRRVSGIPLVNLIFRHMAAEGRLPDIWAQLRPNLVDPSLDAIADQLALSSNPAVVRIPFCAFEASGITGEVLRQTLATMAVYRRGNSRNLLVLSALLAGCPGSQHSQGLANSEFPGPPSDLLPMVALSSASGPTRRLLSAVSEPLIGPNGQLIPSLLRHLASSPALLSLVWVAIQPALPGGLQSVAGVRKRARDLAGILPHPISRSSDETLRGLLAAFERMIPTMIVVGGLIGDSLEVVSSEMAASGR